MCFVFYLTDPLSKALNDAIQRLPEIENSSLAEWSDEEDPHDFVPMDD